jgi:hypothetical protein
MVLNSDSGFILHVCDCFGSLTSPASYPAVLPAAQVDTFMAANAAPDVYVEAATWKLSVLIASYRRVSPAAGSAASSSTVSRTDDKHADRLAVAVWHTAAGLLQRKVLSPDGAVSEDKRLAVAADCQKALQLVGLADCAAHVAAVADLQSKGNEKKGKKEKKGKEKKVKDKEQEKEKKGISEKAAPSTTSTEDARFQLKHCGHLLPRDAPATSDPRVASFNPDPWQRTVRPGACSVIRNCWPALRLCCAGTRLAMC